MCCMISKSILLLRPLFKITGSVVQLVRMPPCHGGGRGFESRPVRKASSKEGAFVFQEVLKRLLLVIRLKSCGFFKIYKSSWLECRPVIPTTVGTGSSPVRSAKPLLLKRLFCFLFIFLPQTERQEPIKGGIN